MSNIINGGFKCLSHKQELVLLFSWSFFLIVGYLLRDIKINHAKQKHGE